MDKVIIYTKKSCVQCSATKNYLVDMGIAFEEVDVNNEYVINELKRYGFSSLPVVAINTLDYAWSGFRPDKIDELKNNEV